VDTETTLQNEGFKYTGRWAPPSMTHNDDQTEHVAQSTLASRKATTAPDQC